jgi:hypothetical protein
MFEANEIVMFFIGLGVALFTFFHHAGLRRLPSPGVILGAFYLLLGSIACTVLEGFFWNHFLNFVEHACLAGSSVLMAIWSYKIFTGLRETR